MKKLGIKTWFALILVGLVGQFAWTIENMYLNRYVFYLNLVPEGCYESADDL